MARKEAVDDLELEDDFEVEEEDEKPKAKAKKAAPKGVGASQIAAEVGADPKTFRAWLRRKVANGDIEMPDHEEKARYNFGNSIGSPLAKKVIKLWNSESHEKGAGLEKAQKAKADQAKKKKAAAKK